MILKLLLVTCIPLSSLACATLPKLVGSGQQRSDERIIGNFDSLEVGENLRVELVAGVSNKIKVTGDDNVLYTVKTDVKRSTLVIRTECECTISPTLPITIEVPADGLSTIKARDTSKVSARGLKAENMTLYAEDKADITLFELTCSELRLDLSDASKVVVSGQVDSLIAQLEDAAQFDAQQGVTQNAQIEIADSAEGFVQVVEELNAELEDQGKLTLFREPKLTKTETKDSGSIVRKY